MSEQLFECQPLLARMSAGEHSLDVCIRRRPMQVLNRLGELGQAEFVADVLR